MADSLTPALTRVSDRSFYAVATVISAGALALIGYILLVRAGGDGASVDLRFMPAVNAALNALAATLLVTGFIAIRRGERRVHQYCMLAAFAASALFLVGYLGYHWVHGDTRFPGTGTIRTVYLVILASHVLLSIAVVPLALRSVFLGAQGRLERHKRIARVTLPIWLYVSVTGVVIFFMLRAATG
jgi:putative membrane protein